MEEKPSESSDQLAQDQLNFSDIVSKPVGQGAEQKSSQAHAQASEMLNSVAINSSSTEDSNSLATRPIVNTQINLLPTQTQDNTTPLTQTQTQLTPLVQPEVVAPLNKVSTNKNFNYSELKKLLTSPISKYIFIGIISIGIFALIFNFPLIYANLRYRFSKTTPTTAVTTEPIMSQPVATTVPPQPLVLIPKINVTAPLQFPPTLDENQIQIALRDGVVHYAGTALPGNPGNVVLFGHSSNDWWQSGNYKYIFALLDRLDTGDTVQLNYQSKKYVYQVTNKKVVEPTDFSVVAPTPQPTLTLITCTPPGTSLKRLVVVANQIEPAINSTPTNVSTTAVTQPEALPSDAPSLWAKISGFFGRLF